MKDNVYTPSSGRSVALRPVSLYLLERIEIGLRKEAKERSEPVDPPRYSMTSLLGIVEEFDHNEATLQDADPDKEAANRAAWGSHTRTVSRLKAEGQRLQTRVFLLEGIELTEETRAHYEAGDWARRQKEFHADVPDDPDDRMVHYLMTEVCRTLLDVNELILRVQGASMDGAITEEQVQAAMELFRHQIRGAARGALATLDRQAGALVAQQALQRLGGSPVVGPES